MAKKTKEDPHVYQGFAPRQDRVLVRVDNVEMKTSGGLIIPEFDGEGKPTSAAQKPNRGTVIAIGPKVEDLSVGSRIIYGLHAGFAIKHMGIDYLLIRATDAFAEIKQ